MPAKEGDAVDGVVLQIGAQFLNSVTALTKVEEDDFSRKASLSYADVKHLQDQIAVASLRLRYIENATRPINRLPSAVLLKIFHILQNSPPYSLQWVVVTRVCSQWRKFALSASALWSSIPLRAKGGSTLIDLFLARSGNTPLTIIFAQDPVGDNYSITRVQSYLRGLRNIVNNASDRIERLVMEPQFPIDDLLRADRLGQTLGQELSRLLLSPSAGPGLMSTVSNTIENTFLKLFSESMPQAQHLELWSEAVPYLLRRPDPLKHLTVLELSQIKIEPSNMDSLVFSKVLAVLDASRGSLRRIVLAGVELRDDLHSQLADGDSSLPLPISLSCLESIEIGDWELQGSLARFLQQLRVPPSASKCIWGSSLAPTAIGPFILPSSESDSPGIHVISRIVLSSTARTDMVAFHKGSLYINGSLSFEDYSPLLNDLSQFQSVHELVLTPLLTPLTVEDWTHLFRLLPNIRKIKVRDAETSRLVRALRKDTDGNEIYLPLPHLVEFDIKYSICEIGEPWKELLENESTTEVSSMVIFLTLLARERAQAGASFGRLGRIHLRLDSRVSDFHDMAPLLGDLRPCVSRLDCSYGDDSYSLTVEERAERKKEEKDEWYLVLKEFDGIWPTKAVYFLRSPSDSSGGNFGLKSFASGHLA
ncbi:hypothetical protein H1R20_g6364, partial [Candolleomyces eurysporus]